MLKKNEIFAAASKIADTKGTKINAAETSRVCKSLFEAIRTGIEQEKFTMSDAFVFFAKEIEGSK